MKTTRQILDMSERDLRRLVARQQIVIADHERGWAGSGDPERFPLYDGQIADARRVKREVYVATKRAPSPYAALNDASRLAHAELTGPVSQVREVCPETLPKIAGGVDYGAPRKVLARNTDHSVILWWRLCHTGWQGIGQSGTFPAELVLATNPNPQYGFTTRTLHSGGRLSAKLLAKHHDEIAAAFGVASLDLHPRKTFVVEGP